MKMSETSQASSENDGKSQRPLGSRRRQVHNEVERRRKDKINGWISKIGELLPRKDLSKPSKINILEQTVEYIKLLVSERNKLLAENFSEVQAEEIKKLKRDLQLLSEQNALYEKLLQQSSISLSTVPKKPFKYSNKFIRKNGVLTVKNAESEANTYVDRATQVGDNMCHSIPVSVACSSSTPSTSENTNVSNSSTSKSSKSTAKSSSTVSKPLKIASAATTSSGVQSCVPKSCIQSNSCVSATLVTQRVHQSSNISQENVIPIINWNDPARNPSSVQAGGVTTVLSQFPVMSTTLGSSFSNVYNKNIPTFIIPTAGNILQSFPAEKPSNTISIICPSTLPILVPQQVLSMQSVARNVGLPPTIICPGPVDNSSPQVEKSNLGSALLTINPNPIVPISSNLTTNTQIILPSQPTLLGNNGNLNLTHNIIPPLLTTVTQNEDMIVPLVQKLPVSTACKNTQDAANASDDSCESNSTPEDASAESKTVKNALDTNENLPNKTSLPSSTCTKSKTSFTVSEHSVSKKHIARNKKSLYSNSPPSLQVLSANKIISLANQSQNCKKQLSEREAKSKTDSKSDLKNVSNESTENMQTDTSSVSKTKQSDENEAMADSKKSPTPVPDTTPSHSSSDLSSAKTNFSLHVLMGDCLTEKNSPQSISNSQTNQHNTQDGALPKAHDISTDISAASSNNTVEGVSCSDIHDSENVFTASKENGFKNTAQALSDASSSVTKPVPEEGTSKITETSNQSVSNNAENVNSLPVSTSSCIVETNTLSNFDNLSETNRIMSSTACNSDANRSSRQNSDGPIFPSKTTIVPPKVANVLQSDQSQTFICSNETNNVSNTCNENASYSINESSINHSLLPSLFSNNQIVNLNSPVLVCHAGHDNASSILLTQGLNLPNDSGNQNLNSCLLHYSHGDFQNFSVLSNSVASVSAMNDYNKKVPDTNSRFSVNSGVRDIADEGDGSKVESPSENNCDKHFVISKKKAKSTFKEAKTLLSDKSSDALSDVSNTSALNNIHSVNTNNSYSKHVSSSCTGHENSFHYTSDTSDILARATETIFCNDILESPHPSKRNEVCFSDDISNLNATVGMAEKNTDSYKLQYDGVRDDHNTSEVSVDKNRKTVTESALQHSDVTDTVQNNVRNVQELNSKQNKGCKMKKSKVTSDSEPPCKKAKEAPLTEKSTGHVYNVPNQNDKITDKNISAAHSNLPFLEKQLSSPIQTSTDEHNGQNSLGNFNNQINISDPNCKTSSNADTVFALTPMLGDILKDVSHNVTMDSRNTNFLPGNENHSVFSSEKNFISFNYPSNSNEDYLNLPRMSFPIIPENSSAPVVNVTSVSFVHSVSLCSTQSDSQKVPETHSSSEVQNKTNPKKKDGSALFQNNHNILNLDLTSANNMPKQSECGMKTNGSETQFNGISNKTNNASVQFENEHPGSHNQSSIQSTNLVVSQPSSQYNSRDNFSAPVSHSISFFPTISNSSNIQDLPCTTTALLHNNFSNNLSYVGTAPVTFSVSGNTNNSFNSETTLSKSDNLSHSLCSLLKENSNIVENRNGTNQAPSQSSSSSSNVAQSKYSALSLISDQTSYAESVSAATCHSHYVQNSSAHTTSGSDGQYVSTVSSCNRNPKTSLSYSAESLLQNSCANTEKNKNNKRFHPRASEKKIDRNSISNMHSISDTNIFMPVTSCDINIQNAPLVPLPPVTSFHNFSSAYTLCETVPSTTIFNSVSRTQDIPLSLSNDNFLNHVNLNVESQMLSNRHEASTVPKPHSNVTLQFENPNSLYNNCSFLPHVKPSLENSRSSESSACFQPSAYNNNYSQQSQKANCCQYTHRAVGTNSDITPDINLSVSGSVPSFHNEKNNFQSSRSGLQTSFSQSNTNFMGNFFYNTPASCHDGNERNDVNVKPSTIRAAQEVFVPEGTRQTTHDQNSNVIFSNRKTTQSNRNKSKKPKNISPNESINGSPICMPNYSSSQDNSCNKVNLSYVPNGYFKSSSHPVLPPPAQIQCSQNKMPETVPSAVIPANPPFNPVLHQQSDNFLNLNFQHPNFTMSPLPRPPTQPLSCSCLTTPIISHTFSTSTPHPVPNFNLSNILPDMGCSGNQVSFSPAKFPMNHSLSSSSTQCQTNSTMTNSAHIVSHQSCAPSLYPPHPPMVRGALNPIIGHNTQSLIDNQVSLVSTAGSVMSQNTTFAATQNPTFRNVIHPITFQRSDRKQC